MAAVTQLGLPTPTLSDAPLAVNACPGEPEVTFVRDVHSILCAIRGPEAAAARVRAEIEFRAVQFEVLLRARARLVLIEPRPTERWGRCDCCGVELPPHIGGGCNLCAAAVRKALRALGRTA